MWPYVSLPRRAASALNLIRTTYAQLQIAIFLAVVLLVGLGFT